MKKRRNLKSTVVCVFLLVSQVIDGLERPKEKPVVICCIPVLSLRWRVNPRTASGDGAWGDAPLLFRRPRMLPRIVFPEFYGLFCIFLIM